MFPYHDPMSGLEYGGSMKKIVLLTSLVVLMACGKGSDKSEPSAPSLLGAWALSLSASCSQVVTFKEVSYVTVLICMVNANRANAEVEAGSLTYSSSSLTTTATKYSCAGEPLETEQSNYTITPDGAGLTLSGAGAAAIYNRVDTSQTAPSTAVTYGCFDEDTGAFTPNPTFSLKEVN